MDPAVKVNELREALKAFVAAEILLPSTATKPKPLEAQPLIDACNKARDAASQQSPGR